MDKFGYKTLTLQDCSGRVVFGRLPPIALMPFLQEMGVEGVWNLTTDHIEHEVVLEAEREHFSAVINTPIKDFSIPSSEEDFFRDFYQMVDLLNQGKTVLVHCMGGHGRTGMVLACLMMHFNQLSAEEVLSETYKLCRGPETFEQRAFVRKMESMLVRK